MFVHCAQGIGQLRRQRSVRQATLTEDLHGLMDALGYLPKPIWQEARPGGNEIKPAMAGRYPETRAPHRVSGRCV